MEILYCQMGQTEEDGGPHFLTSRLYAQWALMSLWSSSEARHGVSRLPNAVEVELMWKWWERTWKSGSVDCTKKEWNDGDKKTLVNIMKESICRICLIITKIKERKKKKVLVYNQRVVTNNFCWNERRCPRQHSMIRIHFGPLNKSWHLLQYKVQRVSARPLPVRIASPDRLNWTKAGLTGWTAGWTAGVFFKQMVPSEMNHWSVLTNKHSRTINEATI